MRPFKFRAWDKKGKRWIHYEESGLLFLNFETTGTGAFYINDELTATGTDYYDIMQFTGLTDKRGVEIFESDILSRNEYPWLEDGKQNYVSVVEWCFAGFHHVLKCVNSNKRGISDGINEPLEDGWGFEVIGNKWQNPELLNPQPPQKPMVDPASG